MTEDRRTSPMRRDFNDLIRDPSGRISEAKLGAVAGKAAMLYLLVAHAEQVLADWALLSVFVGAIIAPDLLKKVITVRAGK